MTKGDLSSSHGNDGLLLREIFHRYTILTQPALASFTNVQVNPVAPITTPTIALGRRHQHLLVQLESFSPRSCLDFLKEAYRQNLALIFLQS